jgi:hypothetical protein
MKKITVTPKVYTLLFNMAIGLAMPLLVNLFIALANNGLNENFWLFYWKSYLVAALMSVPASYVIMPLLERTFQAVFTLAKPSQTKTEE